MRGIGGEMKYYVIVAFLIFLPGFYVCLVYHPHNSKELHAPYQLMVLQNFCVAAWGFFNGLIFFRKKENLNTWNEIQWFNIIVKCLFNPWLSKICCCNQDSFVSVSKKIKQFFLDDNAYDNCDDNNDNNINNNINNNNNNDNDNNNYNDNDNKNNDIHENDFVIYFSNQATRGDSQWEAVQDLKMKDNHGARSRNELSTKEQVLTSTLPNRVCNEAPHISSGTSGQLPPSCTFECCQ